MHDLGVSFPVLIKPENIDEINCDSGPETQRRGREVGPVGRPGTGDWGARGLGGTADSSGKEKKCRSMFRVPRPVRLETGQRNPPGASLRRRRCSCPARAAPATAPREDRDPRTQP